MKIAAYFASGAIAASVASAFHGGPSMATGIQQRATSSLSMKDDSRRDFFGKVAGSAVSAIATAEGLTTSLRLPANAAELGGIALPPIGLGAWSWGDSLFWGCKSSSISIFCCSDRSPHARNFLHCRRQKERR